jgi:protein SCO1/2
MKKTWLYILAVLLIIGAGGVAYWSGAQLRAQREKVAAATEIRGTAFQIPPSVADITLTGGDGKLFKLGDLQGKIAVVFFGYTRCPDICPLTMSKLSQIYTDLGEPEDVSVVLITVDPETDTPEVIQRYAGAFNPTFIGLSGDNNQVATAIQKFYIVAQDLGEGAFAHTDALLILDRQARMRFVYSQDNVDYLREDLPKILALDEE